MTAQFALRSAFLALAAAVGSVASAQGTSARILMFHDVFFDDGKAAVSDDVFPDNFRDMMEFLKRNYNVISLDQLVAWRKGQGSIPTNAVVITFDDNYEGLHDFGRPIMKELGLVGTNFAHTGFVGVLTSRDHADWNELRQQQQEGVLSVESHTVTHPNLTQTSNLDFELQASKSAIQNNIPGKTVRFLAYPVGGYNSTVIARAQVAGYEAAVTTIGGLNTMSTPLFELRRNGIGNDITLAQFRSIMGFSGSDSQGPVIIDNATAGFTTTGTWATVGSKASNFGQYGGNFRRAVGAVSQSATARFTPNLSAGLHDVYLWNVSEADPYVNAPSTTVRVNHSSGTATITTNQRINRGGWTYLGRWNFNSGTTGWVEVSNQNASGFSVVADAAKFQRVTSGTPVPLTPIIVDNGTSGFSTTGTWSNSTGGFPYGANAAVVGGSAGSATATATWTANVPRDGYYEVLTWFTTSNASFRSDKAPYTVFHRDGQETILINQQDAAGGAKRFNSLGTFRFQAGNRQILRLANNIANTGQFVSADAMMLRWVADTPSATAEIVVDNTDIGFIASSNWFASTSVPGYFGANYHARLTASVSDPATWRANLPESGNYEVFARWTTGSNRATAAPYVIVHSGGNTTVTVNQQQNNGVWVSLGTYNFAAGTLDRVRLSCWTSSGQYVVADAVRFVKQ